MSRIIIEKQDLTYLSWARMRNSSGTAGSFLKSYSEMEGRKIYYKLSNFDAYKGIIGHECVNEIIVDRLLTILGMEHLSYSLVHADILVNDKKYETYLCASEDFKDENENKIALDAYYQAERMEEETPLEFCIRQGWEEYIYQMLIVDYLILNRDRHGANIEVLRNSKKKTIRLAPLFDHGLSLLFNCHTEEEVERYDVLEDKSIQCFVGSRSARENLNLIPKKKMPMLCMLKNTDDKILFDGMENILPEMWRQKIWEMIWKRWCEFENFSNQRRE